MTRDDIIRMAREASKGMLSYDAEGEWRLNQREIERFAALVAAAEREVCAQICGEVGEHPSLTPRHCAEAIRARGQV